MQVNSFLIFYLPNNMLLCIAYLRKVSADVLIQPASLGDGLGILVKFAVAIILFEGSLNLRLPVLRQSIVEVRDMITWVLVSLIAHFAGRLSWELAIIFGALMTVVPSHP